MAFAAYAGFTSAIATDPAATAAGYLTPDRYNLAHVYTGVVSGGIPYGTSTTTQDYSALLASGGVVLGGGAGAAPATDTNLTFDAANKRLSVGSGSGTSSGLHLGYSLTSGFGAIWSTAVTPASNNYGLLIGQNQTNLNLSGPSAVFNIYSSNEGVQKLGWTMTAGRGPTIIGGTATTDVPALEVTRTNNNAAVATGVKFAFTDTTSAAGFLPFQVLGGAICSLLQRSGFQEALAMLN